MTVHPSARPKHSTEKDEYPRYGCPECNGPVMSVYETCDMDEEHERFECQNQKCGEKSIPKDDLAWVKAPEDYPDFDHIETLDPAALLKAGRVMPALREWVAGKVGAS